MIALAGSVLVASLLGSAHCAGMCGGFVCFVAGTAESRRRAQAAYHAGRLAAYAALGALAGSAGAGLDHLGSSIGLSRVSALIAATLMVAWGALSLARALGVAAAGRPLPGAVRLPVAAVLRALSGRGPVTRGLALGILTGLLPCGWLYAFVTTAAGTGSPLAGAATMAVFWMGTVPALAAVGLIARSAVGPLSKRLPALTAGLMVAVGLLTAAGRFHGAAARVVAPGASAQAAAAPACHPGAQHGAR